MKKSGLSVPSPIEEPTSGSSPSEEEGLLGSGIDGLISLRKPHPNNPMFQLTTNKHCGRGCFNCVG